ncbi:MAG: hypothetical protein A3D44_01015 [Candidatus Staskawiczbacteria bacterium RIFCSPHIGHO2_02_FULL_42_22]|uniref:DUF2065 domain-containing protein n=1 Tax=Candidatus Staskawiczbacteria bacterium RIFCSPHIGHO2_02_FULL_42_22 TaxID=1802207 RepID=A0A1G2I3B3_9BACT|nr:MAG: hypothetical protein A3D44_01015 [Candidatus Staskawiczbacteria bacterium RIFCSPHIGHO2_02_FULL_42_22]
MAIVNFLAQLWGFSLIIICFSFLVKPQHVKNIFVLLENPSALLVLGMSRVVLGFASLLAYSSWDLSWRVVITILGWLLIIKGVFYLFMPELAVDIMVTLKDRHINWFPVVAVAGIILGCVLLYLGFNF